MDLNERDAARREQIETDERVIPIVAESVRVWKRPVRRAVRIRKVVREETQHVEEPLVQESVEVRRVPVGRVVDGPVAVRHEGDTMIIPVFEEVLVVEKRLVLREELHVTKTRTTVREARSVPLRSTEVVIEHPDSVSGDE